MVDVVCVMQLEGRLGAMESSMEELKASSLQLKATSLQTVELLKTLLAAQSPLSGGHSVPGTHDGA